MTAVAPTTSMAPLPGGTVVRSQAAIIIFATVVAGMVPAVQPILLGALAAAGRIGSAQIGQAATLEAVGMGLAAAACALFACPVRHRWIGPAAALVAAAVNAVTTYAPGGLIPWLRLLSGLGSGVMPWLFVSLAAQAPRPARLSAVYLTAQAVAAAAFAALYVRIIAPAFGVAAGYWLLAGFNLLVATALVRAPAFPAAALRRGVSLPTRRGVLGLLAIACQMAAIFAVWVYALPIASGLGLSAIGAGSILSMAILLQIVSGPLAFVVSSRFDDRLILPCTLAILLAAAFGMEAGGLPAFAGGIVVTSIIWMFVPSFHLSFLLHLDPKARAAMLLGPAQLAGIALGPALSGPMMAHLGLIGPPLTSMGLLFGALALGAASMLAATKKNEHIA